MAREWTEATAKKLFYACLAFVVLCAAVSLGRVAAFKRLWKPPEVGPWFTIGLWVILALALLFAMDRGIPREETWGRRLYLIRRLVVAAVAVTIATMVYLK